MDGANEDDLKHHIIDDRISWGTSTTASAIDSFEVASKLLDKYMELPHTNRKEIQTLKKSMDNLILLVLLLLVVCVMLVVVGPVLMWVVCVILIYIMLMCCVSCWVCIVLGLGFGVHPSMSSKKNLNGYYAIVTLSNQSFGVGYEVARYLVNHGAHVVLACDDNDGGLSAERRINKQRTLHALYPNGIAQYIQCDLSKLQSTKSFVEQYQAQRYPLHLLINAACFGSTPNPSTTQDGIQRTFQVNYLAHFLITHQLLPVMIRSASNKMNKFDCRIVNTSSSYHELGFLDLPIAMDKPRHALFHKGSKVAYANAKLAQILHATYLQREVLNKLDIPLSICSVNPGGVVSDLFNCESSDTWPMYMRLMVILFQPALFVGMMSSVQSSRNILYCALAPVGDKVQTWGGVYTPGAYHWKMKPNITTDKHRQAACAKTMEGLYNYSLAILKE
eukprot:81623_1